jgi:hypothetical protein
VENLLPPNCIKKNLTEEGLKTTFIIPSVRFYYDSTRAHIPSVDKKHNIRVLNIAGPRESSWPGIHERACILFRKLFAALRASFTI